MFYFSQFFIYIHLKTYIIARLNYVSESRRSKSNVLYIVVSLSVPAEKISKYYYDESSETNAVDRRVYRTVILANLCVRTYIYLYYIRKKYLIFTNHDHFTSDWMPYFRWYHPQHPSSPWYAVWIDVILSMTLEGELFCVENLWDC